MMRLIAFLLIVLTVPAAAQQSVAPTFAARFASLASLNDAGGKPVLKAAVSVTGGVVRIGDLVENAGDAADIAIFRAPDLGQTGNVSVARILEALAPHEVGEVDTRGLTDVVVTRSSRPITPDDIEARIVRALAGRHRIADAANLAVTFDIEPLTIQAEPDAELRLARIGFEPRTGRFDVMFELPGSARRLLRYTGSFAETFEAAVLTRPVHAGVALKASDFKFVRRPKGEFAPNIVTEASQALGLAARQPLRPGQMLRQTDLMKPEIVARNEAVTITYDVPGITLSLRGKAMEAGALGDIISVMNLQSKRTIQAAVSGPGHVTIAAPVRAGAATPARLAAETRIPVHPHAHVRAE
jgi:flagellar basal body P-ring formation protein FlgA